MAAEVPTLEFVNPGPLDPSLLVDQENHISRFIWQGNESDKFEITGGALGLKKWVLNERQQEVVRAAGFGFCLNPANIVKCDVGLVQALIERWRPETNTFHLPVGEVGITLEDVKYITGLPIRGRPVTSVPLKGIQRKHFQRRLNLQEIKSNAVQSSGVGLPFLRDRFGQPRENMTEEDEDIQVVAFLLDCIGSVILPSSHKGSVHAKYLGFLEDLGSIGTYSWGSSTLCHLFRALTRCTVFGNNYFHGCGSLLQVWAWERISVGRPVTRAGSELTLPRVRVYGSECLPPKRRRDRKNPHHESVVFYRGELDSFSLLHTFIFDPYDIFLRQEDNGEFLDWRLMGRARLPLIHFDEVEYQLPERILRQFSLPLEIPTEPIRLKDLRAPKSSDFDRVDPTQKFSDIVEEWVRNVVNGPLNQVGGDDSLSCTLEHYLRWYFERTRLRIHPPKFGIPPGSSFYPRSIFSELQAFDLIEAAIAFCHKAMKVIPESCKDVHAAGSSVVKNYTSWGRGWRHPRFLFVPPDSEEPVEPQQSSEQQQHLFVTPSPTRAGFGLSHSSPESPIKDKGKRRIVENSPLASAPSFSLGLGISQDETFSIGKSLDELTNVGFFKLGYEDDGGCYLRPIHPMVKGYIDEQYFADSADVRKRTVNVRREGDIPLYVFQTLKPFSEIYSHIIVAYVALLRERELAYNRKKKFWVTDTMLMDFCFLDWDRFARTKPAKRSEFVFSLSVLNTLNNIDCPGISILDAQYALIPFFYKGKKAGVLDPGHFSMMMLGLRNGKVAIIESIPGVAEDFIKMYDKQLKIMCQYLPLALRKVGVNIPLLPDKKREIRLVEKIPKQNNSFDCGIFLLKIMDAFLRQEEVVAEEWTEEQIISFRYWIAWELINDRPRG